jgi:hypothetical protein
MVASGRVSFRFMEARNWLTREGSLALAPNDMYGQNRNAEGGKPARELFAGAISFCKNPSSHHEIDFDDPCEASASGIRARDLSFGAGQGELKHGTPRLVRFRP